MLNWLITTSLKNRLLVAIFAAGLILVGGRSLSNLPIDAFPDTTPVQVQINTVAASLGPEEVEQRITFPIEQAIGGLPGLENMRSVRPGVKDGGATEIIAGLLPGEVIASKNSVVLEAQLLKSNLGAGCACCQGK